MFSRLSGHIDARRWIAAAGAAARFCTARASASPRAGAADSLFERVVMIGDPMESVVPVLEEWAAEGRPIEKRHLQRMIKRMRSLRRFAHGLQISVWMSDRRYFNLSSVDVADRLSLIYKIHGLEQAENYFHGISKKLRFSHMYGALLGCYVEDKAVEKAEALFEAIKKLNIPSSFAYNLLMKLYSQTGHLGKVNALFRDMEEKGFAADDFTYGILMEAYSNASDAKGMDGLVRKLDGQWDPRNWHAYAIAAKGYARAGLADKAVGVLKKSEGLLPRLRKKRQVPFGFLLTVYAELGMKAEVFRIWKRYRKSESASISMYMCMIGALLKLDDIGSAESIYNEWEGGSALCDFRVAKLLLVAYCRHGLLGKAETLATRAVGRGAAPFASSWDLIATGYFEDGQAPKGVQMMRNAFLAAQNHKWEPNPRNVIASLRYFESRNDLICAVEFVNSLRPLAPLAEEVHHSLQKIRLALVRNA